VDARPWQRAATCWTQAVLVLRWFKDASRVHLLARDAGISQATAYRYLHEAIYHTPQRSAQPIRTQAAGEKTSLALMTASCRVPR
jgi:hypothetical protein